jgi:hypothetical protein
LRIEGKYHIVDVEIEIAPEIIEWRRNVKPQDLTGLTESIAYISDEAWKASAAELRQGLIPPPMPNKARTVNALLAAILSVHAKHAVADRWVRGKTLVLSRGQVRQIVVGDLLANQAV